MNRRMRVLSVFSPHSIVRRAVASWFWMAFVILTVTPADYGAVDFLSEQHLSLAIFVYLGFFLLFSVVLYLAPYAKTDSFALLMGLVLCTCLWLAGVQATEEFWLFCVLLVGIFALVLWDFVRETEMLFEKFRISQTLSLCAVILCGIVCAAVIAVTTCCRYLNFSSPTYDFGIFIQMYHNMAESLSPVTTCERDQVLSHFAVHLSPIYYFLLPFYWLFPSPLTLQIGQAIIVASGIVPFWLLMRKWRISPKAQVFFAALYLLNPAVTKGCFFDLHENAFLLPLLLWLFLAYEAEKLPLLAVFTVLCCLVKEDASVYVILFGLYAVFSGEGAKRKLMGLGVSLFAFFYFIFAVWYIDTFGLGIMVGRYDNVSADGTLLGIVFTAFANPGFFLRELLNMGWGSLRYIVSLLLPFAFLPLATGKPSRWILLTPMLLNLLTDYPYQLELRFQYHFGVSAFLLYAALQNGKELCGRAKRYLLPLALAASFVFYSYYILPDTSTHIEAYLREKETFSAMEELLDIIPEDASVTASTFLLPHLAQREYVYDIDYHQKADTDFVIIYRRFGESDAEKAIIEKCVLYGFGKLAETDSIAIYISPLWWGDEVSLRQTLQEMGYQSLS